jgi:DNA repair photolyase
MLFPELASSGLVGIARSAAEADIIETKRRVEYFALPTRRWIGRASGRKMAFEWTINPYRGCEFGCKYCYARYTHEFMELRATEQFETLIYAKELSLEAFQRELARIPHEHGIAIGTATDPYQPAERRFGLTRRLLSVFAETPGRTLTLTTKSDLVARDADLLGRIAQHSALHVFITITTVNECLARILEPFAPRPALRLAAIRKLADAGVRVVVLACPVMPLINDSHASLSEVAHAASEAGALYMFGNVLFLKPCAQKAFFPMLEQEFPHLARRYRERYERRPYLNGRYPEMIRERMQQVRERYGLTHKPARYDPAGWAGDPQLALFD